MVKIRYRDVSDSYRIRYAEYIDSCGVVVQEIVEPSNNKERVPALVSLLKGGEISNLVVKGGFCWAEYYFGGYMCHSPVGREELYDKAFCIAGGSCSFGVCEEFDRILNRLVTAARAIGGNTEGGLKVVFGPRVPQDYYGDYDYSKYPGGYSPSAAMSGDW